MKIKAETPAMVLSSVARAKNPNFCTSRLNFFALVLIISHEWHLKVPFFHIDVLSITHIWILGSFTETCQKVGWLLSFGVDFFGKRILVACVCMCHTNGDQTWKGKCCENKPIYAILKKREEKQTQRIMWFGNMPTFLSSDEEIPL